MHYEWRMLIDFCATNQPRRTFKLEKHSKVSVQTLLGFLSTKSPLST